MKSEASISDMDKMDRNELIYQNFHSISDDLNEENLLREMALNKPRILNVISSFYKYFNATRYKIYDSHRQTFTFFQLSTLNNNKRNRPLRIKIITYFVLYSIIKLISLNIIYYISIGQIDEWEPKVRENAPRTEHCALKGDIYGPNEEARKFAILYQTLLGYLGFSRTSLNIFWVSMSHLTLIFLFIDAYYRPFRWERPIFNNPLSFFLYPVHERRRVRASLLDIVEEIFTSDVSISNRSMKINECICKMKRIDICKSLKGLIHRNSAFLLRLPAHLSPRSYSEILKLTIGIYLGILIVDFFSLFWVISKWVIGEIDTLIEQRMREIDCQRWNPNATVIVDPNWLTNYLKPSESKQALHMIESTEDIITNYILFGRKFMTIYTCISLIETLILAQIIFCFSIEEATNRYTNIYSIKTWLKQIEDQLETCLSILKLNECYKYHGANMNENRDRALLLVYVSLQLLFKEYREPNMLIETTTHRFMTQNLLVFLYGYIYSLHTKSSSLSLIFTLMTLIFFNCDSSLAISMTNTARNTFKLLNQVIGQLSSMKKGRSCTFNLLRRHLLSDEEVQELFAVRIIGIKLTQRTLISINTYAIGAVIFMMQTFYTTNINQISMMI